MYLIHCVHLVEIKRRNLLQEYLELKASKNLLKDVSHFFFKCDIPVVFYKFNIYSVQLAVETQIIYCTVCTIYKNYMFRPILAIFRFFI